MCTGFQHVLCFIYLSLISQHTVTIFYLHGPILCIKVLIKDSTVTVFMVFITVCMLMIVIMQDRVPNFLKAFELFDGIFF